MSIEKKERSRVHDTFGDNGIGKQPRRRLAAGECLPNRRKWVHWAEGPSPDTINEWRHTTPIALEWESKTERWNEQKRQRPRASIPAAYHLLRSNFTHMNTSNKKTTPRTILQVSYIRRTYTLHLAFCGGIAPIDIYCSDRIDSDPNRSAHLNFPKKSLSSTITCRWTHGEHVWKSNRLLEIFAIKKGRK